MRLIKFSVKNFKGIQTLDIEWDTFLVLIGENNCGKSSVLSALSYFLSGSAIKDISLFRRHQVDELNAIELVGHFDQLSQAEQQQVAVNGRMHEDKWILKKRYWYEAAENEAIEQGGWKEQLYSYSSQEIYNGWPATDTSWSAFPAEYQPIIQQIANRPPRPNAAARDALKQLLHEQRPDLIAISPPSWVPNPGGGGNWKSNANSILPRAIFVRAVHEASDETNAKDASTYGKLINLVVERQLSQRPEMQALKNAIDNVLQLFRADDQHPERQALEIQELQARINRGLSEVIGGQAFIRTEAPEIRSLVMPSTSLVIKDPLADIETEVSHQGHGLQRTLIITLLQILSDFQTQPIEPNELNLIRSTILLIEEPELYLHPQMERLMRDVLYRLASQPAMQVACCTHSPVFLDIANKYQSIVRLIKQPGGDSVGNQVTTDIFTGNQGQIEKVRLQTVARFHPSVNELFFAKHVVLFEEFSAIAAIQHGAELTGIFTRHTRINREIAFIDCDGKTNIPAFQRILNAFSIPYRVIHDMDTNNAAAFAENVKISRLLPPTPAHIIHMVSPSDLETLLGYQASKGASKPYTAVKKVEDLYNQGQLPQPFIEAINMAYFGNTLEPV